MSRPSSRSATVAVRRADFLAIGHAVLGAGFLVLGLWQAITGEVGLDAAGYAASGVILFAVAVYYRQNPYLIDRGTRPTPRRWVEFGGVVAAALVILLVAASLIQLLV